MTLPTTVALFLSAGLLFGLLTFTRRHLFSEGHTRPGVGGSGNTASACVGWTVLCSVLWPLMAVSGAFSWWVRRGRR